MKIKSILSIAAFSTAFIFSTFLAGLFFGKSDNQSNPVSFARESQLQEYSQPNACRMKKRIWLFLDKDRTHGLTMERDLRSQTSDMELNEQRAITNLAAKMNQMNDSDLPSDFRSAWVNHVAAWDEQASFLTRVVKSGNRQKIEGSLMKVYLKNDQEIDRTYSALLNTAEKHGVYFPQ